MSQILGNTWPRGKGTAIPRLIAILVGVAILVGILSLTGALARVESVVPGLSKAPPSFQTSPVSRGNLMSTVTATGPIAAGTDLPLTFKNGSKLAQLKVAVGDRVTKGEVLAVEDTSDFQTALDQAKANLAQQQANLEKLEAGPTDAQKQVAQASVNAARSAQTDAQAGVGAARAGLANDVAVAQGAVSTAQATVNGDQAAVKAAQNQEAKGLAADQAAVTSAQKNLSTLQASLAANVPVLEQAIEQAKDNLWSAQSSRDMVCSRSSGGECQAANASVAAAETAVNTAQAQLTKGQKDSAQQLAQAEASLSQAQNQLTKDKTTLDAAVVAAQNQLKTAEVGLTNARTSFSDAQTKASATVQTAQSQANQAASSLTSAQASYNQTVAPPTRADLDAAKAQVANAEAAVRAAQANLDSATLVSPIDGVVAAINGSVGQWITGGATAATSGSSASNTALFTLISLNDLQVTGQVNEADIAKVKIGDPVTFQVDAFPNKTFTGKVLSIQPVGTTSQNVVNFNVTTSIQSTENANLYPGMTATLTIIAAQKNNVLEVSNAALSFPVTAARDGLLGKPTGAPGANPKGANPPSANAGAPTGKVQIVGRPPAGDAGPAIASSSSDAQRGLVFTLEKGKLKPVPVVLGMTDGTSTEVVSGLPEGAPVVVGVSGSTTSPASQAPALSNEARPAPGGGAIFIQAKGG